MNPEQNAFPASEPPVNDCVKIVHPNSAMIQFVGKRMTWGFGWSLLHYFVLKANPDCHDPKVEPAQELIFYFQAAKVTLLGWRLDLMLNAHRQPQHHSRLDVKKGVGRAKTWRLPGSRKSLSFLTTMMFWRKIHQPIRRPLPSKNSHESRRSQPSGSPAPGLAWPAQRSGSRVTRKSGRHRLDAIARAHMERALAHVREACIAINEAGHVRTVEQLGNDLLNVERLSNQVRQQSVRV